MTEYYSGTKPKTFHVGDRQIQFSESLSNRVSLQKAPLGYDATPITLSRFYYHFNRNNHPRWGGHTEVYDAHDQRTVFHYSDNQLLYVIERFDNAGTLLSVERLNWGANGTKDASNLLGRSWSDGNGIAYAAKTFTYDERGNVLEEKVWGNHTGQSIPLVIQHATPMEDGAECETKTFTYSSDGFNLLLSATESNGKSTRYSYHPGTDLLTSKLICENGQIRLRYFYEYDEDAVMIRSINDDGTSPDKNDLANVTERHITHIHTRQANPAISQPEVIEEKYLEDGQEDPPKKTILSYSQNDLVIRKEIFNARGESQYSLYYDYDAKDRLVREADPLGNEKRYHYDGNDNLILIQGPRPDVQIENTYDFANRMIRSEEKHSDGSAYITRHSYDYLGNEISTQDSFGHVTSKEYDAFGRLKKAALPGILIDHSTHYPVVEKKYDLFGHVIEETDPKGFMTKTRYTVKGKPCEILYPDGTKESFTYYLDGALHKSTAKDGSFKIFSYDFLGRPLSTETYSASNELLDRISSTYNAFHQTSSTDGEGHATFYTYDKAGRLAAVIKGSAKTTYEYDALGNQRAVKTWFGSGAADFIAAITEYDIAGECSKNERRMDQGRVLKKTAYIYDNSEIVFKRSSFSRPMRRPSHLLNTIHAISPSGSPIRWDMRSTFNTTMFL